MKPPELTPAEMIARMEALATRVEVRDERGRCPICAQRYPAAPKPMVCPSCEHAPATPSYREWPPAMRAYLVYQSLCLRFGMSRTKQHGWEHLLRAVFTSKLVGPDGRRWPLATPVDQLFLSALHASADWVGSSEYTQFLTLLLGTDDDVTPDARTT